MLEVMESKTGLAHQEQISVFETAPDVAAEARLDALADAEIEAGQGVGHDQVREWLTKLGQGEKVQLPTA